MTKQGYIRNQLVIQHRLMAKYMGRVFDALQGQIALTTDMVQSHGADYALAHIKRNFGVNDQIEVIVNDLYRDAAVQASAKLTITKSALGFIQGVLDYFAGFLFEKVVIPISQTTEALIQKVLEKAIEQGWGVDKTVQQLKMTDVSRSRARTIVRTESVRAMNYAQMKAADNKNFETEKMWIAIEDKRTRYSHTHAGVDGERRDLKDRYSNGLLYPGDPQGDGAETINCRCTQGYYLKRDLQGNLIPKEKNILQSA